jgi:hypothetical protein
LAEQRLTPTQKAILQLMREHQFALFGTGDRRGLQHHPIKTGGVWIAGYSSPEYRLKARGLIEPVPVADEHDSTPGRSGLWMRLSAEGQRRAAMLG